MSIHHNQPTNSTELIKRQHSIAKKSKYLRNILKISTQYPKRNISGDTVGFFLNGAIIFVIIVPIPVTILAIATHLDPFYFIFEQLLLPHPYYRSISVIILLTLTRVVLGFFCVVEFLRFVILTGIGVMILVFAIVSISQKLVHVFDEKCATLYVQLRLVIAKIENLLSFFTAVAIFGSQFVSVLLIWVVFKCFNLLSIYLYIIDCFLAGFFITFVSLILPAITTIHSETEQLVKRKITSYHCACHKSNVKYYYYLWKAQQSVYFKCSTFFVVNKKITALYSKELINNIANAILLIDPKIA